MAMAPEDVDLLLYVAKATINFQQHIVDALMHYKTTGTVPDDVAASIAVAGVKKRGKKPKLNKDGSEKQPRKPTAYNHWMQQKLKELKEAPSHDPEQKHVDTFKQAANIWASMSKEEKETITSVFKEKSNHDEVAHGDAEAAAVLNAHAAAEDEDDSDEEEDETPQVAAVPQVESSSDESLDEDEAPAPAPKQKPAPPPAPAAPATDGKKKKKRKPAAEPVPAKTDAAAADADKPKKKKKKDAAAA